MKNKQFTLLTNVFILGTILSTGSMYPISVYLENNYGETVNYKTSATDAEGKNIGTNVRVLLGDINSIQGLWIRTTSMVASYFSSSSYYDLSRFLDEIKSRRLQHPNDDAIIAIDRSGAKQWTQNLRWEPKSKLSFDPLTGAPKTQPINQPLTQPAITEPATLIGITLEELQKEEALMAATTADARLN